MDDEDITKGIPFEAWNKENCWKSYDRGLCPICGRKLTLKYEGLVCKNSSCRLYFKLGKGWVYLADKANASKNEFHANIFYNSSRRMCLMKEWATKKRQILIRDGYKCMKCSDKLDEFCPNPPLCVHHIIPASEEMALYFDDDNLITLCEKCHKEIHKFDKHKFGDNYDRN